MVNVSVDAVEAPDDHRRDQATVGTSTFLPAERDTDKLDDEGNSFVTIW